MKKLFVIGLILLPCVGLAKPLDLSAFPKIPYAVRDACIIDGQFYFLTDGEVLQATPNKARWEFHPVITSPPGDRLWSMKCTTPITVTYVRAGVWRSTEGAIPVRGKIKLPRGSTIDNWTLLASGDVAVLRDRHVEIFTNGPRWKLRQRLPGGGVTTQCAESQNKILSSTGQVVCRYLAPGEWQDKLIVPHNKVLLNQVLSRVPMIDHGEIELLVWDAALEGYQVADHLGPLPGELTSYFIDKNPTDGLMTLFLVAQIRSAADAVGGLTNYSVLVPVSLESLQKSVIK